MTGGVSGWDLEEVAGALASGLRGVEAQLRAEQATRGLDALPELELHAVLRGALESEGPGWVVLGEQRYPSVAGRRRRSEGERCDLVLLPEPVIGANAAGADGGRLVDPLEEGTLFAGRGVEPESALWLEVKSVAQHTLHDGWAQPNPSYGAELLRGVMGDVRKLSAEPRIVWAGVLVALFTSDAETASHDLRAWRGRAIESGLPVSAPATRSLDITDRLGNSRLTLALWRVHHL